MKRLILLTLTLGILWAVGAQATDPPVFKFDSTTGQYYYNDANGQPIYIPNEIGSDSPDESYNTPPADDGTTTGTTTPDATSGTSSSDSGNTATDDSSTTGETATKTDTTTSSNTTDSTTSSTDGDSATNNSGNGSSTTGDTSVKTDTTGTTTSNTTGSATSSTGDSATDNSGNSSSTTDNASTETSNSPDTTATDDNALTSVSVGSVPDYADYWITACPNYLTQIDLNAKEHKVATVLSIEGSKNSHVTDNKDGTLSYIPNKGFTNGVDTLSITYQTPQGDKATAIIKARMECKEVLKTTSCKVYISHNSGHGNTQFATLDPEGQKAVTLGPMYRGYDIEGLAFNPKSQLLYALSGGIFAPKGYKGELYLVDPSTGNLSIVGNTGFPRVYGLAARADGSLWAWVHTSSKVAKPGGILQIDPDTAISNLKFISAINIDGLAWSSDGKTLYGSEEKNLWAWKYDGETFNPVIPKGATQQQPVCSNLPFEVEGLSSLQGNMLLFGGHATKERDNQLVVFNPLSCKAVITHTFANPKFDIGKDEGLEDSMEGIVWTEGCQPEPKVTRAEVQQFEDIQVCDESANWQAVVGKVSLTPNDSKAYVKTSWSILSPSGSQCPTGNEDETAPCKTEYLSSQIVEHNEPFSIDVWWPGMTSGKKTEIAVSTQVFDMEDSPLSEEVTHYLRADKCDDHKVTREAIIKDYLGNLNGVDSFEYNYTDDGIVATLVMSGQNKYRVEITPVKPATLSDEVKDKLKANSIGSKDENGFAPLVKLVFADDKRMDARFNQINTITYKSALTSYLAQITADENIQFGANGALTVIIDGETYKGTLFPALAGGDLPSKAVEFTPVDDIDGNGHTDFTVRYADGVEQTIYIIAVPGGDIVEPDEVIDSIEQTSGEQPVLEDGTSEEPSNTVKDDSDAQASDQPSTVQDDNSAQTSDKSDTVKDDSDAQASDQPSTMKDDQSSISTEAPPPVEKTVVEQQPAPTAPEPATVVTETPVTEAPPAAAAETPVVEVPSAPAVAETPVMEAPPAPAATETSVTQ